MKQAGQKTGRLSSGAKMPRKDYSGGLDWDKIARERAAKLAQQWEDGIRNVDTIRARWLSKLTPDQLKIEEQNAASGKPSKLELGVDGEPVANGFVEASTPKKQPSVKKHQGRVKPYDVDQIVELYVEQNMAPKDIAARDDMPTAQTVIARLKDRGVFDPKKFRQGWMGAPDGKNPSRPKNSYEPRKKYCGVCGTDLDIEGNSAPKIRHTADGQTKSGGRDCIPCRRRRAQEHRDRKG